MWRSARTAAAGSLLAMTALAAGQLGKYSAAIQIPRTRAAETYAVYSQLLRGDSIEWAKVARTYWLIEQTTHSVPVGVPCHESGWGEWLSPRQAIEAPAGRGADLTELLADFDLHCHVSYKLEAKRFTLALPVRILDEEGQRRFAVSVSGDQLPPPIRDIRSPPPITAEFEGAAGLHSFTAVYFNRSHTLAMSQIGMFCGSLCGNWSWVVLEKTARGWQDLHWRIRHVIS